MTATDHQVKAFLEVFRRIDWPNSKCQRWHWDITGRSPSGAKTHTVDFDRFARLVADVMMASRAGPAAKGLVSQLVADPKNLPECRTLAVMAMSAGRGHRERAAGRKAGSQE